MLDDMKQMMVVVPVDPKIDEAEHVRPERRPDRAQSRQVATFRHAELEDHDRDEDGDDAVAEGFEPRRAHHPLASVTTPHAISGTPEAYSMRRRRGASFSTSTRMAIAAAQNKFITPTANINTISPMQQPTQNPPWCSPIVNAPTVPSRRLIDRNCSGGR